jgi:hypothetical protein
MQQLCEDMERAVTTVNYTHMQSSFPMSDYVEARDTVAELPSDRLWDAIEFAAGRYNETHADEYAVMLMALADRRWSDTYVGYTDKDVDAS